jgi:hypothetical protein
MQGTIFENIYSKEPFYKSIDELLERIKNGASKSKVEMIRATIDKDKAEALKKQLPAVCFSGKFTGERLDEKIIEHSGFIVLDFDKVDVEVLMPEIQDKAFIYAAWLSPRGNGIKALAKIADKTKHREHFEALKEIWPNNVLDRSGVNPSRVCFESFDEHIYINKDADVFRGIKIAEKIQTKEVVSDVFEIFKKLLAWLSNSSNAFVTGERNTFIFKLASACCRYGISKEDADNLILNQFQTSNDFTARECLTAIRSAFRANAKLAGSAEFDRDILVEKTTRSEVTVDADVYNPDVRPKDVVYGIDVKDDAMKLFMNGYESVTPIGVPELDKLFKMKRAEISLLTGIGNYGKSQFKKWYQVCRAVMFDEKFASFPPEDYPIQNYYHELTEILLGCDCTPNNPERPSLRSYNAAYDFISSHFFYIYPTDLTPTPEYVKTRFLELVIKENVDGVDIDPFNQMTNDYGKHGGRSDKYLETVLSDFLRFAQTNNIYFWIVAHPKAMQLASDGNYPCPNVFDIADGAMWNNKMNNILVYHRPFMQSEPQSAICHLHTKKIKDQKAVGEKGSIEFEYFRRKRRYQFDNGVDYLAKFLEHKKLFF